MTNVKGLIEYNEVLRATDMLEKSIFINIIRSLHIQNQIAFRVDSSCIMAYHKNTEETRNNKYKKNIKRDNR